uniref:Secreted protein n=1 Tax=Trichogramma kaykai TaxID=54128 RepID=A0ABD2WA30_9HYME
MHFSYASYVAGNRVLGVCACTSLEAHSRHYTRALRVDRADDHHRKLSVPRALVQFNVPSEVSCNFANCTDEKIILVAFLG